MHISNNHNISNNIYKYIAKIKYGFKIDDLKIAL